MTTMAIILIAVIAFGVAGILYMIWQCTQNKDDVPTDPSPNNAAT